MSVRVDEAGRDILVVLHLDLDSMVLSGLTFKPRCRIFQSPSRSSQPVGRCCYR